MPPKSIALDQEPIWEIQFDETVTQYRAFALYRDLLEGRSIAKVAAKWGKNEDPDAPPGAGALRRLQVWSSTNRWVERAEAYDLHLQRKILDARETQISRMAEAEAQMGRGMVSGVLRRLFGYEDKEDPTKSVEAIDWSKITPGELAMLGRLGVDVSRLSTNRPTSLVRGALMITSTEFVQATSDLTEILMRHIPEERKPIAAEEIRAYAQGERRMLTQG